jgi:hypothetical protein
VFFIRFKFLVQIEEMFRKLSKVVQHFIFGSFQKKKLYLESLKWSIIVRFSMVFLPFKFYKRLFGKIQYSNQTVYTAKQLEEAIQISKIVISLCRNTPWESKCLVEALSCKRILKKRGIETTVYLGICKNYDGKELAAHAWLKMGDYILTGRSGHQNFKVVNFYS